MIDWHSHILPGIDDGSHDAEESVSLINMQASQGIDIVIATPHFYANHDTVDSFLEARRNSYELLKTKLTEDSPRILLGAEVRYYQGISRMDGLKALRIEGSKLLLLEMPETKWTEYMVRELIEMASRSNTKIVLAHVERHLNLQSKATLKRIIESGIMMQVNASFFTSPLSKRKALSLLKQGNVQFIGSDCHNTTSRPPKIDRAFEIIEKKLGEDYLQQMDDYGNYLLNSNK